MKHLRTFSILFVLLALLAVGLPATSVHAASCIVTSNADSGVGSLREKLADVSCDTITFNNNYTINLGSTLTIDRNLTIDGTGYTITISGQNAVRIFYVNSGVTVTFNSLIISNGYTVYATSGLSGAGIYNRGALTITNSTLSGNRAPTNSTGSGGAIYNDVGGSVTIDTSTLSDNYAYGDGGAIHNHGSSIVIMNSTLRANSVTNAWGGAIYNDGANLAVINSTLVGNVAYQGGAIYNGNGGNLWTRNATIVGNTAELGYTGFGGGGIYSFGSYLYMTNTIIANSGGGSFDCASRNGAASENANNLIRNYVIPGHPEYQCATPAYSSDPLLGSLANNGGPTLTMALGEGSPAINTGDDGTCAYAAGVNNKDQRGVTRPQGTHCDIGAYEYATKDITAFVFTSPAATGVFNGTNIAVRVPHGTDITSLVPTITHNGASINPASGVAQNFASPLVYTVTSADGSTKAYTVTVTACDPTSIVSNANDSGAGSLREAIIGACSGGTITFADNFAIDLTTAELTINKDMTIDGSGHTIAISGLNARRVFYVNSGVTVTLNNLRIRNGYANNGGGIYNNGFLTLNNNTLSGNTATGLGGGIYNFQGDLTISKTTLSGNTAVVGGGINNFEGFVIMGNSTLYGNTASNTGGAINNGGPLTIMNGTLSRNSATGGGGGIYNTSSLNYANTIIADSTVGGDCVNAGGAIGVNNNNLVEDGDCLSSLNGDPGLSDPAANGGTTWSMAIGATSKAVDAGSDATCAMFQVGNIDQRGMVRPQGAHCDIGAYEFDPLPAITSFTRQTPAASSTNADVLVFRATFSENVQNVDTSDFSVGGGTTATVTLVTPITGTRIYDVTVSGGDLVNYNGTVGLNLKATQNILDMTGNALPNSEPVIDETYSVVNILPPTDIGLSNSIVDENRPSGTLVGILSTTDPNIGDSHTYSLVGGVAGCNGTDNASLQISGNQLKTAAVFDYETKSTYYICVRTTDSSSLTYTKAFTITVTATKSITDFTVPGQVGGTTINQDAGTITLSVPYGTDLTTLTPTIVHTGVSVYPLSGDAQNFSYPVLYVVKGLDNTNKAYWVTVTIACGTNITVTNVNDSDAGSLRAAITDLCAGSTITFAPGLAGSTIPLVSQLDIPKNLTIDGTGLVPQITISGEAGHRVFSINSGVTATLNGLKIANGTAPNGGGILNNGALTVSNSTLSGNTASSIGGAILNNSFSTLTVTNSSFLGNSATYAGGAVLSYYEMTVENSTFSGNSVTAYDSIGGAIHSAGGVLTVTNSTFSGNRAGSNDTSHLGSGGALSASGYGTLTITNSTLAGNFASLRGSAIYTQLATLNYSNTILSGTAPDFYPGHYLCEMDGPPFGPGINSHNLVEDGSCSSSLSGDPLLGPLQDNGGPTWTMALGSGSNALDAGDDAICAASANSPNYGAGGKDQRGNTRPSGAHCDIGAYEFYVDTTAPSVSAFTVPAFSNNFAIPISEFTGTDDVGVTDYLITESGDVPAVDNPGWAALPSTYSVTSEGSYTLYPWVKDAAGNISSVFATPPTVVVDTNDPSLILPANMIREAVSAAGRVVTFSVTAFDLVDADPTVACVAPSGSIFGLGLNTVNCTATDDAGNVASGSFTITVVDTTDPNLTVPTDFSIEATSAAGAVATFSASATDLVDATPTVACVAASGSTFALGINTVNCTATDDAGNVANGSFTITVVDTTDPNLTVPTDFSVEATSAAGAVATFSATATDIVDATPTVNCDATSGSTFPLGPTTVACTATDDTGNIANGFFTITVVDTTDPILTVPANITGVEATGPSGAVVTYSAATATDAVDTTPTVACVAASGSTFALGINTVNCTATDDAGNVANGSFTITVVDTTDPNLTVPTDFSVEATSATGAVATFSASATDLVDATPTVACVAPSGSTFALGINTVNCTATDDAGNVANGSFTITVVDTTDPNLTVPTDFSVEATSATGAVATFSASATDLVDATPTVACVAPSGSTFALGLNTVNCTATDDAGNVASGSFSITVVDTTDPNLTVPTDFSVEATSAAGAVTTFSASATDLVDATPTVACVAPSGSTFALGLNTVNCTATDDAGNVASGSFSITVVDTTDPNLTVPTDFSVEATSAAGAVTTFSASATDLVDATPTVACVAPSGSTFALGLNTVNCTATDDAGNVANGSFTITVVDTTDPNLTVPTDFSVEATSAAGAVTTFSASATDLVDATPTVACVAPSGSTFALGINTVNCTATDDAGNVANGSFTITVVDTTAPNVTVPSNMIVEATSSAGAVVNYSGYSATDTVAPPSPTVTCVAPSGSTFPLGTTPVDCSATDTAGNTGHGYFNVTVQDTTPPVVTVPANMIVEATSSAGAVVTYSGYSATDTVAPPSPAVTCVAPSGSTFPLGVNTVNCSATDTAGNTGTNSFTITVRDTTPPVVTVPANMIVEATNSAGAVVTYSGYSATDTVAPPNPAVTCVAPSGSTFPLGVNTVNCSATDTAGNTGNNSFTIQVRDTTLPVVTVPANMIVEATSSAGAVVTYSGYSATDTVAPPNPTVTCVAPSGSTFPLGVNTVNCSATDTAGNTGNNSFTITVRDTTAPTLNLPANMTVYASSASGAVVTFSATATDLVAPANPAVTCVPLSGSTFPLGTTTVNCSATDTAGNTANGSFTINVVPFITTPQLLKMPTFDNLTKPIPWTVKLPTIPFASVRDCTVSLSPNCSVKFVGKSTNPLRYAEQSFIRRGNAGDKFYIGLSSRAESVPAGGLYKVEVFFYNLRNQVVGTQALNFSIGTHDWETLSTTYTVPAAYYRVAYRFTFQKTAGTAWFDNAFLMIVP